MNPVLALIITNIIWGAAAPVFKYALTNIPPFTLAFVRFFFASMIFLPLIKLYDLKNLTKKDLFEILAGSFFGIFVNITFFFLGLQKTESINAPIIASCAPLFIFLFSVMFLRERPQKKVLIGMTISFLGALTIIFSPIIFNGGRIENELAFEGNLMIVVATLGYVLSPIFLKRVLEKVSPYVVSAIGFFASSLLFLPFAINEMKSWNFLMLNTAGLTGIIFGVFFSSALAYFFFYYGLSKIHAQEVGIFTYIDPVAALIIAALLLHEYPKPYYIVGSILIFGGIFVSEGRLPYHPINRLRLEAKKVMLKLEI
jgi:drug/metabolite transporter (DMT)-like permease